MRLLFCLLLLLSLPAAAKNRKDVPLAPLPKQVLEAKKIFLANGGGSDLAYDAFYAKMKSWAHYTLVDKLEDADLIVEFSYTEVDKGTRVYSTTNSYTKQTQVHSHQVVDPQLNLIIYDPKTKASLWSTTEHRQLARLEKNREKETINAAERLVDNLKVRVESPAK